MSNIVYPRRLVMIQMGDDCMFCEHPKGVTMSRYVDLHSKLGYIYCDSCSATAAEAVKNWHEKIAYGKANYLKDKIIQVKRTSGDIETGWNIDSPVTSYDGENNETIHCYNASLDIGKWCLLEDILQLNPE
uniref:Uncharacterized protein n=1 Tax=viral metagenome TaxID=1070528 RepID=A0A6C0III0_9ZZZZ